MFHVDLVNGTSTVGYLADAGGIYPLRQATAALRPIYYGRLVSVFNNRPCLYFPGDVNLRRLVSDSFSAETQPNAICIVLFFDAGTAQAFQVMTGLLNSAGRVLSAYNGLAAPVATEFQSGPYIVAARFNGTDSVLWINGREVARGDATAWSFTNITLGDAAGSARYLCPALWAAAHGSPSEAEVQRVMQYFAQKYDVRLSS